jgi:hypothetical protein
MTKILADSELVGEVLYCIFANIIVEIVFSCDLIYILQLSFQGAFTKYVMLVGVGGCLIRSHIVSQEEGGVSQVVSRNGEAYRETFIHVYNKTRPCLQIDVPKMTNQCFLSKYSS